MPTISVTTKHRPVRIGLLVRPDELGDLERAAGLSTLLWGGVQNPLIPVSSADDKLADQLVDLFRVDVLYPVGTSEVIDEFKSRHPYLRAPLGGEDFFWTNWSSKKNVPCYLDSSHLMERLWQEEYRHRNDGDPTPFAYPTWDEDDELRVLLALIFGFYPTDQNLLTDFRELFQQGIRARPVPIKKQSTIPKELASAITPVTFTGLELRGSVSARSGIYLGDPQKFPDLVNFWNIRASGAVVGFLAVPDAGRTDQYGRSLVRRLDDATTTPATTLEHIFFHYQDKSDTAIRDVIDTFWQLKTRGIVAIEHGRISNHPKVTLIGSKLLASLITNATGVLLRFHSQKNDFL